MLELTGSPLTIADVVAVARRDHPVSISAAARARMEPSVRVVAEIDAANAVAYGVTTGFGALADRAIAPDDRLALQRSLVASHAAGVGPPLPREVVRAMVLLRARTLCAGHSGARPALAEAMTALLNRGITPWVPSHGSLGASGDLAPLAHVAQVLLGNGEVLADSGTRHGALAALQAADIEPITLGPKEGITLINGTDGMAAILALAVHDLGNLLRFADCTAAMSIEAQLGTDADFDQEVIALRASPGAQNAAGNLRALLHDSPIIESHRHSRHAVQDAYSLRCCPQVHGAARDLVDFCTTTVERELASVVDNPVVMAVRHDVVSNGNFHGQALAYAADCAAMVCADMAAISERRTGRLLDPARSRGLPAFLVREPGLNSGLMMAQYTAAALVARLRTAATPLSVQSASTSAGQEDHVSMGFEAALRTRQSIDDLRAVLAIELLCASQALELRTPLRPAPSTAALLAGVRAGVAFLDTDRALAPDIEWTMEWAAACHWVEVLEPVIGTLR